ncbi:hypothetical protein QPK13_12450 [Photorhabdus tasmaniensis]
MTKANNAVPNSRKINGKTLSGDVSLSAGDVGACRAYSGSINTATGMWTTAEFLQWLKIQGAFDNPYWICKGSWSYADNRIINDTGCGNICLAGAVVEVMGVESAMTIRVTTPTTTNGNGIASVQFTYINHGEGYYPGWRRDYNTANKPTAEDVGACRAYSGSINTGGGTWTTKEFIVWLKQNGAFDVPYWMCKGSWSYADNRIINDTGCGNICLAGAVVEVMGVESAMTIRVTTPTTTVNGGISNAQFTYINHGEGYYPGWRRDYNIANKPTAGDVGAYTKTECDSRYSLKNDVGVINLRLGSWVTEGGWTDETKDWSAPSGHVLVGLGTVMWSSGRQHLASVHYRPVQAYINGIWVTISAT